MTQDKTQTTYTTVTTETIEIYEPAGTLLATEAICLIDENMTKEDMIKAFQLIGEMETVAPRLMVATIDVFSETLEKINTEYATAMMEILKVVRPQKWPRDIWHAHGKHVIAKGGEGGGPPPPIPSALAMK